LMIDGTDRRRWWNLLMIEGDGRRWLPSCLGRAISWIRAVKWAWGI